MSDDKRLIEDYIPIQKISAEASREKSVRKGHISTLHLWWARRPLVACRAAVYGALVPASRFVPPNGSEAKAKSLGRANAAKFVERLCKYPGDQRVIKEAQQHILEAHAERLSKETGEKVTVEDIEEGRAPRPKVLDMFAGGGAIPLEALRLGCEAYALDLNPVAHIIQLCTLVYPQKYGKPDKNAKGSAPDGTWAGLAKEVEYWGNWVLDKVRAEIGDLYPPIPDPRQKGEKLIPKPQEKFEGFESAQAELTTPHGYLTPVAYLWTRTVKCKNPGCEATVPLLRQTWLCKKKNRHVALKMIAPKGEKKVRFEVVEAEKERDLGFDPEAFSKGGNASCPFCRTVADNGYIKTEGSAERIGLQMMAVACSSNSKKGKVYLSANDLHNNYEDINSICKRIDTLIKGTDLTIPTEPMPPRGTLGFRIQPYGILNWGKLFTPRQILCLLAFAKGILSVEKEMKRYGYDNECLKVVMTYLGTIEDRLADFNSSLCVFNYTGGRGVVHTFGRHALPMVWDFAETNPFNPDGASWISGIEDVPAGLRDADMHIEGHVQRGSATTLTWSNSSFDAVITDPPYYDNVPYADISDFFYVWLKRTIGHIYPEHFTSECTPKKNEAVADPIRYSGNREKAKKAYEAMMAQSFREAYRVLKPDGYLVTVYAHKTTIGWATLVEALRIAGFIVTEAWPLDTEKPGRLRAQDSAALASSIFLVACKREENEIGAYEFDVRPELENIVRERVETLWDMGISGGDLVIAAVGAGLRAFTKYAKVEYDNGVEVPAEKFLAEVEGVVLETLLEKIFGVSRAGVKGVDGPTQFYVLWRYTYKAAELDAGEAIVFTYGIPNVELDGQKGLSTGNRALVEKKKSKYRIKDFTERGDDDKLGLPSDNGATAPLIDILHRILYLMENRPAKLAEYLHDARPNQEHLRLVAQALAGAGLKGKSEEDMKSLITTTATEQAALAKLMANWRSLIEGTIGATDKEGQARMEYK
jgi:putative DNA methylase